MVSLLSPVKALVDKATVDDANPTPGYLFNEINRLTFQSVEDCSKLQECLIKRLVDNDSVDVKLKVLKVIRHALLKGHPSFRNDMRRATQALRHTLDYRGTDVLRGDHPFRQVREEGQAIMDILFTDTKTRQVDRPMEGFGNDGGYSSSSSPSSSYSPGGYSSSSAYAPSSSSSYGSSYPSSSSYSSGGGHRRMEGMGNITFPAHKEQSGISGFFGKVKQKLSKLVETEPDSWDRSPEPSGSYTDSLSNASLPPQVGQLTYEADSSYSRGDDRDRREHRSRQPHQPGGVWARSGDAPPSGRNIWDQPSSNGHSHDEAYSAERNYHHHHQQQYQHSEYDDRDRERDRERERERYVASQRSGHVGEGTMFDDDQQTVDRWRRDDPPPSSSDYDASPSTSPYASSTYAPSDRYHRDSHGDDDHYRSTGTDHAPNYGASPPSSSVAPRLEASHTSPAPSYHVPSKVSTHVSFISAEQQLVQDFTLASGVRLIPTRVELASFTSACGSLDDIVVIEQLCTLLCTGSTSWQTRLRALCALEALLRRNHTRTQEAIDEASHQCIDALRDAPQKSLRERAVVVSQLLQGTAGEARSTRTTPTTTAATLQPPIAASTQAQPAPTQAPMLLLDPSMFDAATTTPEPSHESGQQQQPAQPQHQEPGASLFSGLAISSIPPPQPQQRQSAYLIEPDLLTSTSPSASAGAVLLTEMQGSLLLELPVESPHPTAPHATGDVARQQLQSQIYHNLSGGSLL